MTDRFWENLPTGTELPWGRGTLLHRKPVVATLPAILCPQHRDDLIRLGINRDGGYVLTRTILDAADFLVSAGLGYEWSFEAAFATQKKIKSDQCCFHGYDPTIFDKQELAKLIRKSSWRRYFTKHNQTRHTLLTQHEQFFNGSPGNHYPLWLAQNPSAKAITLDMAIEKALESGASKVLVKVDIEQAEYDVVTPPLHNVSNIAGLICEFHELNSRRDEFLSLVEQLKQDFHLVHVSGVNCARPRDHKFPNELELTFEHKSLGEAGPKSGHSYPIKGIDFRSKWNREDYILEFQAE